MLDEPTELTPWERDRIKLDFALFIAKRARRFHVEPEEIFGVVTGTVSPEIARFFLSHPVANVGEGANGATAAASIDPASREADSADRQQPATSGLTGEGGEDSGTLDPLSADTDLVDQSGEDEGEDRPELQVLHDNSPVLSLTARLTALYAEHPDWTCTQFCDAMPGSKITSVSSTLTQVRKKARQSPVEAREPDPAPEPAPAVERPPTIIPEPEAFVPPPGEDSERSQKRRQVAALHKRHPSFSPEDAAARLLIPLVNLRIFSGELGIAWGQPMEVVGISEGRPQPQLLTLRAKVAAIHRQHPTWTAQMITDHLGANYNSVNAYLTDLRGEARDTGEPAPFIGEAAMRDEAIARKRRLGVAV